jgi:hypothetical protein
MKTNNYYYMSSTNQTHNDDEEKETKLTRYPGVFILFLRDFIATKIHEEWTKTVRRATEQHISFTTTTTSMSTTTSMHRAREIADEYFRQEMSVAANPSPEFWDRYFQGPDMHMVMRYYGQVFFCSQENDEDEEDDDTTTIFHGPSSSLTIYPPTTTMALCKNEILTRVHLFQQKKNGMVSMRRLYGYLYSCRHFLYRHHCGALEKSALTRIRDWVTMM